MKYPDMRGLYSVNSAQIIRTMRKDAGLTQKKLAEKVRFSKKSIENYEKGVTMKPEEDYKISDHMTPFYTRLFLRDYPEHETFFATKPIRLEGFKEGWIDDI